MRGERAWVFRRVRGILERGIPAAILFFVLGGVFWHASAWAVVSDCTGQSDGTDVRRRKRVYDWGNLPEAAMYRGDRQRGGAVHGRRWLRVHSRRMCR
ncbi:MAG: hypothetical protein KatS3mg076_2352 [Candidatus Binatia bacterium]|nr:MAG: hypothetical protein KatS3mg076_2352 [Candidatus Binatia bacterium]